MLKLKDLVISQSASPRYLFPVVEFYECFKNSGKLDCLSAVAGWSSPPPHLDTPGVKIK